MVAEKPDWAPTDGEPCWRRPADPIAATLGASSSFPMSELSASSSSSSSRTVVRSVVACQQLSLTDYGMPCAKELKMGVDGRPAQSHKLTLTLTLTFVTC